MNFIEFKYKNIDIFCDVVDNFGDAGVTYRLVRNLIQVLPEVRIRLFTNDLKAFSELNCEIDPGSRNQILNGIEFYSYDVLNQGFLKQYPPADLIIEAFACHIPEIYYKKALEAECLIINFDHLSAEKWIEGVHLKQSLTGAKAKKYFFMPGFNESSGGLILNRETREEELAAARREICNYFRLDGDGLLATVFSYEHDFSSFISDILSSDKKIELIVFGEKSRKSMEPLLSEKGFHKLGNRFGYGKMTVLFAGFIRQEHYDDLLKVTDFNIVRGEDSWARACLSGKPFIWHSYHQEDNYQLVKVKAFNEMFGKYFENSGLFEKYSEYQTVFNDRSDGVKDLSFSFFLDNLSGIEACSSSLSKYLIRNCNLIKNLLFFAGSLKEL